MLSPLILSTLPILVLDVSDVPQIEVHQISAPAEHMRLINSEGEMQSFKGIPSTHGILFIGAKGECFESIEQLGFAFNSVANSTTAAEALTKLVEENTDFLNQETSPLYSHLQLWVDSDGTGACTQGEVYSAEDLNLSINLSSISRDEFKYGKGWSIDAKLYYTFKSYNEYGEYKESSPKPAYSSILTSQ